VSSHNLVSTYAGRVGHFGTMGIVPGAKEIPLGNQANASGSATSHGGKSYRQSTGKAA